MTYTLGFGRRRRAIGDLMWTLLHGLTLTLATAMAIVTIPDDANPRGALVVPSTVFTIGLLLTPSIRAARGFDEALRGEHVVSVALAYWLLLDLIQGAYEFDFVRGTPALGFVAIALFSLGTYIGASIRGKHVPRVLAWEITAELSPALILALALLCFALGVFRYAFAADFSIEAMVEGLKAPRFEAPWSRGALGDWNAVLDHLAYFGFVLPVLYVIFARRRGWLSVGAQIVLAMAMIFVAFVAQGGGRRIVGVIVGAGIVAWAVVGRRMTPTRILVLVTALAGLLAFMQVMLGVRNLGVQGVDGVTMPAVGYLHVDDNFYRLGQAIEIFPNAHEYVGMTLPLHVLMRPIPRALWADKPVDGGFDLAEFIGLQGVGLSMSVVGELITVYGFVATVVGGIVYGLVAGLLNRLIPASLATGNPVQVALLAMVLFVGIRSMYDLVVMSYAYMGWVLLRGLVAAVTSQWALHVGSVAGVRERRYPSGRRP